MAPVTGGLIGPVLRMCSNSDCGGLNTCDAIRLDAPIGVTKEIDPAKWPGDEDVLTAFRDDIALDCASDSAGVRRMIPDGCEFIVHKGRGTDGTVRYTAIYSGPDPDPLAGTPEWDWDVVHDRFKRMRGAGRPYAA